MPRKYKVIRENRLLDIDLDTVRERVRKPVESFRHRKDHIYHDTDDLWFWHDGQRKRVSLCRIKSVEKTNLHGFGKMIKLTYLEGRGYKEDDRMVPLHILDVEPTGRKPEDIACELNDAAAEARKREANAKPRRHFASAKQPR